LAKRLKELFPRLPIVLLMDGLYPNSPVLDLCRRYHWQYMIVLKDGSLPSVWEEVEGLKQEQSHPRAEVCNISPENPEATGCRGKTGIEKTTETEQNLLKKVGTGFLQDISCACVSADQTEALWC
jgi:hypothetical protein